jgi:hypothetical protein
VGSNELGWVRLEFDVLISLRDVRPLTPGERVRLEELLGRECQLRGFEDVVIHDAAEVGAASG